MLKMNEDLEGALKEYLCLLENQKYFEAHEVLEEAWHPLRLKKDPLANLLKGLINAAIAFEHIKRNKKNSVNKAKKVMISYERYKSLSVPNILHWVLFQKALHRIDTLKKEHKEIF